MLLWHNIPRRNAQQFLSAWRVYKGHFKTTDGRQKYRDGQHECAQNRVVVLCASPDEGALARSVVVVNARPSLGGGGAVDE